MHNSKLSGFFQKTIVYLFTVSILPSHKGFALQKLKFGRVLVIQHCVWPKCILMIEKCTWLFKLFMRSSFLVCNNAKQNMLIVIFSYILNTTCGGHLMVVGLGVVYCNKKANSRLNYTTAGKIASIHFIWANREKKKSKKSLE